MRTILLAIFATALVAGCGATDARDEAASPPPPPPPATATGPSGPPPELDGEGPPPAWVETRRGAFWLGYSSYCWKTMCADYIPPRCGDERFAPTIEVDAGETVRFHLGFEPREVGLRRVLTDDGENVPLESGRDPGWRVTEEGVWMLFVRAAPGEEGADASYAACLKHEALTVAEAVAAGEGDVVVAGPLWAQESDVRLCDAVAESYPPQCPSGYLRVRGLELGTVEGLQEASGIRWTEKPVRLEGTLEGNVLRVRG